MSRRLVILVLAFVVSAVGASLFASSRPRAPVPSAGDGVTASDVGLAARDARKACQFFDEAVQLVRENGRTDQVMSSLGRAVRWASHAANRDPAWRGLLGGLQAVRASLERDDPRAADVGMRVVVSGCQSDPGRPPPQPSR